MLVSKQIKTTKMIFFVMTFLSSFILRKNVEKALKIRFNFVRIIYKNKSIKSAEIIY